MSCQLPVPVHLHFGYLATSNNTGSHLYALSGAGAMDATLVLGVDAQALAPLSLICIDMQFMSNIAAKKLGSQRILCRQMSSTPSMLASVRSTPEKAGLSYMTRQPQGACMAPTVLSERTARCDGQDGAVCT